MVFFGQNRIEVSADLRSVLDTSTRPDDRHIRKVRTTAIGARKVDNESAQVNIAHAFERGRQALTRGIGSRPLQSFR